MAQIRNRVTNQISKDNKKILFEFFKKIGADVRVNTKAHGHQGFCRAGRIDISKELPPDKFKRVLVHEFAHFSHFKKDENFKNPEMIFDDDFEKYRKELRIITDKVFDFEPQNRMIVQKTSLTAKVKDLRSKIREEYPDFSTVEDFKEFKKYVKKSDAKYLLKYDRVLVKGFFGFSKKILSVDKLDEDFPFMPEAFKNAIIMKSFERKRTRLNSRISKINKYLDTPAELFARFVEAYFFDKENTFKSAPLSSCKFEELLKNNYYPHLKEFFEILNNINGMSNENERSSADKEYQC